MKKILYLLSCMALCHSVSVAQTTLTTQSKLQLKSKPTAIKMDKRISTGLEGSGDNSPAVPPSASARSLGKSIGITNYDLGSNGAVKPRLINFGNKKISAAFNYGTGDIDAGVADRGSGYNTTDATGKFAALPKKRVESLRTGFTNLCADADGNEYLFAHKGGYQIMMSKKLKGATTWTESNIPTDVSGGVLWSSAAIGGKNGKSIHLVASTVPTTLGGVLLDDIDGAMVYFRSTDGGATWDKKDVLLPGIEGTRYNRMSADAYSVAVKGDKVVIASYGDFYDTEVWISEDNGEKFTRKTVFDFPIPNYKLDDLYTTKDIPKAPSNLDSLAIQSTDACGAIFIDNKNKAHLVVGNMYYLDADVDDGAYNYYPSVNGFFHWDENTADSLYLIDAYPDVNGNDTIDIGGDVFGRYGNSMTCHPSMVQGADNVLYLSYTAPSENYLNDDETNYARHVFIIHSKDGGKTWSKPYDIIDDKTLFNSVDLFQDIAECTFPYLAENVDNNLHLIYQMDYTPGLHVLAPATAPIDFEDNDHIYTDIPTVRLTASKEVVVAASAFQFGLSPNPTTSAVNISYNLEEEGKVSLRLYDLTGRQIQKTDLGNQNAGSQNHLLSLNLNAGLYFVQLNVNGKIATQKLVVR